MQLRAAAAVGSQPLSAGHSAAEGKVNGQGSKSRKKGKWSMEQDVNIVVRQ